MPPRRGPRRAARCPQWPVSPLREPGDTYSIRTVLGLCTPFAHPCVPVCYALRPIFRAGRRLPWPRPCLSSTIHIRPAGPHYLAYAPPHPVARSVATGGTELAGRVPLAVRTFSCAVHGPRAALARAGGGAAARAGRPPTYREPLLRKLVTLSASYVDRLVAYGGGNPSDGIRLLVEVACASTGAPWLPAAPPPPARPAR